MNLIQLDDSKKAYFRQNLASLLFHMKKLHNSKTTSLTDQDLLSTSLSDPFQSPDSKFRKTVLIEIITNMCQGTDEDTARKELRTFIEYIASCGLDIHLYEALVTLIKLFNSRRFFYSKIINFSIKVQQTNIRQDSYHYQDYSLSLTKSTYNQF